MIFDIIIAVFIFVSICGICFERGFRKGFKKGVKSIDEEMYHNGFRDGLAKGMLGGDKDVICVASVCGKDIEK